VLAQKIGSFQTACTMEQAVITFQKYDWRGDGTLSDEEMLFMLRSLDNSGYWTQGKLDMLLQGKTKDPKSQRLSFSTLAQGLDAAVPKQPSRAAEESLALGVSVDFLQHDFLKEVASKFGDGVDPDYYELQRELLIGSNARGYGKTCPRDGQMHCSYVDALGASSTGPATLVVSWCWQYTLQTVANTLVQWCKSKGFDTASTYVWQCALCNNQFRLQEGEETDGAEVIPEILSSVQDRIRRTGHVLAIVSPWHNPIYNKRAWTIFEFWTALSTENCKIDMAMPAADLAELRSKTLTIQSVRSAFKDLHLEKSESSKAEDKHAIMNFLHPQNVDLAVTLRLRQCCIELAAAEMESRISAGTEVAGDEAAACYQLSQMLAWIGNFARALAVLEECNRHCVSNGFGTSLEQAVLQLGIAEVHLAQGKYSEATNAASAAIGMYTQVGMNHLEGAAKCMVVEGAAHGAEGRDSKALELFGSAKNILESCGCSESTHYALLLARMGACYNSQGDETQALHFFVAAMETFQKTNSVWYPTYAAVVKAICTIKRDEGHHSEVMTQLQAEKAFLEGANETSCQTYPWVLQQLGNCYLDQGDNGDALVAYHAADVACSMSETAGTPAQAVLCQEIGGRLRERGYQEQAVPFFRKATSVLERLGMEHSMSYCTLRMNIGTCLWDAGCAAEAVDELIMARKAFEAAGCTTSVAFAMLLQNLGVCYRETKEQSLALDVYKDGQAAFKAVGAECTPGYATLLMNMGIGHFDCGEVDKALDILDQSATVFQEADASQSLLYASLLQNIAVCHLKKEDYEQAVEVFSIAKGIYEDLDAQGSAPYAALLLEMDRCRKNTE